MDKKDSGQHIADAIAHGISGVLDFLSNLEHTSGGRSGEFRDAAHGVTVSYRFGARPLKDVEDSGAREPEGTVPFRARQRSKQPLREQCEPVVDVFDEGQEILVVADMPGAAPEAVQCRLDGDILTLQAETAERTYRTEVLIGTPLDSARQPEWDVCNGVLRVKLHKRL